MIFNFGIFGIASGFFLWVCKYLEIFNLGIFHVYPGYLPMKITGHVLNIKMRGNFTLLVRDPPCLIITGNCQGNMKVN